MTLVAREFSREGRVRAIARHFGACAGPDRFGQLQVRQRARNLRRTYDLRVHAVF